MTSLARTAHADLYVFDDHGGLWAVCDCNDGRAQAFGPTGCARPVLAGAELEDLGLADGDNTHTLYVRARDAGRVLHADADDPASWDVLLEEEEEEDPSFLDKE